MGCPQMSQVSTSLGMRAPWCCDVMPTAWAWMDDDGVGYYPQGHIGGGSFARGWGVCTWEGSSMTRGCYLILGALITPFVRIRVVRPRRKGQHAICSR